MECQPPYPIRLLAIDSRGWGDGAELGESGTIWSLCSHNNIFLLQDKFSRGADACENCPGRWRSGLEKYPDAKNSMRKYPVTFIPYMDKKVTPLSALGRRGFKKSNPIVLQKPSSPVTQQVGSSADQQ